MPAVDHDPDAAGSRLAQRVGGCRNSALQPDQDHTPALAKNSLFHSPDHSRKIEPGAVPDQRAEACKCPASPSESTAPSVVEEALGRGGSVSSNATRTHRSIILRQSRNSCTAWAPSPTAPRPSRVAVY